MEIPFDHSMMLDSQVYELKVKVDYAGGGIYNFSLLIPRYHSNLTLHTGGEFGNVMLRCDDDDIFVEYFNIFVNNPDVRKLATSDELKGLKGMGKKLLCFALTHLKPAHSFIQPDRPPLKFTLDTTVTLVAGGIVSKCDVAFYNTLTLEQLLDRIKSRPSILALYRRQFEYESEIDLASFLALKICELEANDALVNYYKTVYGFEMIDEEYSTMRAPLRVVLSKCG